MPRGISLSPLIARNVVSVWTTRTSLRIAVTTTCARVVCCPCIRNGGERLIIQIDTREQKYDHVQRYFDAHGIKTVRSKCVVGDYVNLKHPMVVVDRKKDLQEVAGNVCQQHDRFVRELELANALGYKLIVLVEEPTVKSLVDVCAWFNWRRKKNPNAINGKTLYKIMRTMEEKYGITWEFTSKEKCGERIVELLGNENE